MKKLLKWIITLAIFAAIALGLYQQFMQKTPEKAAPVLHAHTGNIKQTATAVGFIVPKHTSTVKSAIAGTAGHIFHDVGDYIKKGETLLQVDPNPTPIAYAKAVADLKQDQITLQKDLKKLKSIQFLIQQKILKPNDQSYRDMKATYATDQSKVTLDKQNLSLLKKGEAKISGTRVQSLVKSPIDGFILQRGVDVGDPIISLSGQQAATPLFEIANMHDMIFKGSVDQNDANRIKVNMPATITVAAQSNQPIQGTLTRIGLQSDQQNGISQQLSNLNAQTPFNVGFRVEITRLKPGKMQLRSGYSATATITVNEKKNVLLIPERIISYQGKQAYVTTLLPNQQQKKIKVTLGISNGIDTQVINGIDNQTPLVDISEQPTQND